MAVLTCTVCGEPAPAPLRAEGRAFCCHGCRDVWRVLGDGRLAELRARPGVDWSAVRTPSAPAAAVPTRPEASAGAGEPRAAAIALDGLWCPSCALLVEHVLGRVPGVLGVRVDFGSCRADVAFDSARTTAEALGGAVRRLGYGARAAEGEDAAEAAEAADRAREADLLRRLAAGAALAVPVMMASVLVWSGDFAALPAGLRTAFALGLWVFATPIVFWAGWPFLRGAWSSLRHGVPTMDLLVSLGSLAAYAYSTASALQGGRYLYFDIAGMLMTFLLLGRCLEAATRSRAAAVGRLLLGIAARRASVRRDGHEIEVAAGEVRVGETVVVRPGQRVPVDGRVTEGASAVDEAVLTGEALPADKRPGDMAYAGTLNGNGRLALQAVRVGADTVLAGAARAAAEAQAAKGAWQRLADRVVRVFVPAVLALAIATFLAWRLLGHLSTGRSLLDAVAVLVIACPCALGVATPLAAAGAARQLGRRGILLRSGDALERAAAIDAVVFDKTGTLTDGAMRLVDCAPADPYLLALAASVEAPSEHPLAQAVVAAARERGLPLRPVEAFAADIGAGVRGRVDGREVRVGVPEDGVPPPEHLATLAASWQDAGRTALFLTVDGAVRAALAVSDWPRREAPEAVAALQARGLAVVMATGDAPGTAAAVAGALGIADWHARQRPADKAALVRALQQAGRRVAFVGDGINDAAALVQADLGIALAGGADIAVEAGQVTLVRPDLRRVEDVLAVARRATAAIRRNLLWALLYNLLAVPAAAAGLAHPLLAAAAMVVSSAFVLGNSLGAAGQSPLRWAGGLGAVAAFAAGLAALAWWRL